MSVNLFTPSPYAYKQPRKNASQSAVRFTANHPTTPPEPQNKMSKWAKFTLAFGAVDALYGAGRLISEGNTFGGIYHLVQGLGLSGLALLWNQEDKHKKSARSRIENSPV